MYYVHFSIAYDFPYCEFILTNLSQIFLLISTNIIFFCVHYPRT
jgi:hypothetical protein